MGWEMGNDVPAISLEDAGHTEKESGYEFTRKAGDGLQEFKSAWDRGEGHYHGGLRR